MLVCLIIIINVIVVYGYLIQTCLADNIISRSSFPKGFVFGTASSAYQVLFNSPLAFPPLFFPFQYFNINLFCSVEYV